MLSVVICTYNEEKNLPRVVKSVKNLANEIVVVDTESTDKTVETAKKLGCKVYHHKNTQIIEPVRNFAVSKAKGEWILLLDADEEVSLELAAEIIEVLKHPTADYYRIPRQNIIFGKWIKSDHWWPDFVYRLFKQKSIIWSDKIHSLPQTSGQGSDLSHPLIHHHYDSVSQYLLRLNRYTDIQADQLVTSGYTFFWPDLIKKPFSEFLSQLFARNGLKDGLHGLVLSLLQTFSEFVVYLKVWQASGFTQQELTLASVDRVVIPLQKDLKWWQVEYRLKTAGFLKRLAFKLRRKLL